MDAGTKDCFALSHSESCGEATVLVRVDKIMELKTLQRLVKPVNFRRSWFFCRNKITGHCLSNDALTWKLARKRLGGEPLKLRKLIFFTYLDRQSFRWGCECVKTTNTSRIATTQAWRSCVQATPSDLHFRFHHLRPWTLGFLIGTRFFFSMVSQILTWSPNFRYQCGGGTGLMKSRIITPAERRGECPNHRSQRFRSMGGGGDDGGHGLGCNHTNDDQGCTGGRSCQNLQDNTGHLRARASFHGRKAR